MYQQNDQPLTITETNPKIEFPEELWNNGFISDFWYGIYLNYQHLYIKQVKIEYCYDKEINQLSSS